MLQNPNETIVPLLLFGEEFDQAKFIGTGAFVEQSDLLLTAKHVVESVKGKIAVPDMRGRDIFYTAEEVIIHPTLDLALLKVPEYEPTQTLSIADPDKPILRNGLVCCLEYSTTRSFKDRPEDPRKYMLALNPATRLGNVTRTLIPEDLDRTKLYSITGSDPLELSFPAIVGSSGAPVILNGTNILIGVIIHNIGSELLPVYRTTVLDEKNDILEETKYMLPQALAIHCKHVRSFINGNTGI